MAAEIRRILGADLYRYRGQVSKRAYWDAWMHEPGFRFICYLRRVSYYSAHKRGLGLLAYIYNRVLLNHYRFRYGFDISPATKIGPGFYLGHFGGTVINPAAIIGANVNINRGATIGATSRGSRMGTPVLGDRVWVGSNATIVGRITVGDDALIAPGAYVNFDVPPGAVVLGNPGQIVSNRGSEGYVNNLLDEPLEASNEA